MIDHDSKLFKMIKHDAKLFKMIKLDSKLPIMIQNEMLGTQMKFAYKYVRKPKNTSNWSRLGLSCHKHEAGILSGADKGIL